MFVCNAPYFSIATCRNGKGLSLSMEPFARLLSEEMGSGVGFMERKRNGRGGWDGKAVGSVGV